MKKYIPKKNKIISVGDFKVTQEDKIAILDVLKSEKISEGEKTKEFQDLFAAYIRTRYCVALNSGTSAIIAGLTALIYDQRFPKVKRGSKVITTPLTYVASSNAITLSGLVPVYADILQETFSIDPEQIERILKRSKNPSEFSVILPVHLMGYPCDMYAINKIAKKYDLVVFEDSAQAHGSQYDGKRTGSLSLLSAFSFYVAHNIQAGELGAITTCDSGIARLIKQIKSNGRVCACDVCLRPYGKCIYSKDDFHPRFRHNVIGYNFKVMEFQCALAINQLKKADLIFKKRLHNIQYLNKRLCEFHRDLVLPTFSNEVSYLAYPIIIRKNSPVKKCDLTKFLEQHGIETRPLFGCIPNEQPAYAYLKKEYAHSLKNADFISKNGFYIGCHQYLGDSDLDYIASVFKKFFYETV
jgi:dTDP-4-amino-4,6-dideoxygalactose transaminase